MEIQTAAYIEKTCSDVKITDTAGRVLQVPPGDVQNRHRAALAAWQAAGNTIAPPPVPDLEAWINRVVRPERDRRMAAFEWRINRYHRAVRLGNTPVDDIAALDRYMQELADLPELLTAIVGPVPWPTEPDLP